MSTHGVATLLRRVPSVVHRFDMTILKKGRNVPDIR